MEFTDGDLAVIRAALMEKLTESETHAWAQRGKGNREGATRWFRKADHIRALVNRLDGHLNRTNTKL